MQGEGGTLPLDEEGCSDVIRIIIDVIFDGDDVLFHTGRYFL
jgi:hypothetical protein